MQPTASASTRTLGAVELRREIEIRQAGIAHLQAMLDRERRFCAMLEKQLTRPVPCRRPRVP
jgi:hypothetical protein